MQKYTLAADVLNRRIDNRQAAAKRIMNAALNEDSHDDVPEILIYDTIGDTWFDEGVTGKSVTSMLRDIGNVPNIRVKLNTYGGDVFDGLVIYDALARHSARIDMEITGIAASAGSYIFQAGDTRKIVEGGMVMIHDAMTFTYGNAADHLSQAEILEKISNSIASLYASRSGRKVETFRKMMTANGVDGTWFTADEAVAEKLADEVIKNKKAAAPVEDLISDRFSAATRERLSAINAEFQRRERESAAEREKIKNRNAERLKAIGV